MTQQFYTVSLQNSHPLLSMEQNTTSPVYSLFSIPLYGLVLINKNSQIHQISAY